MWPPHLNAKLWREDNIIYLRSQQFEYQINLIGIFFLNQAREFLSKLGDLGQTQIFAKIESVEVRC